MPSRVPPSGPTGRFSMRTASCSSACRTRWPRERFAANYCAVDALRCEAGAVRGARVIDRASGESLDVHARLTVNAAGPWVDEVHRAAGTRAAEGARTEHVWAMNLVLPGAGLRSALGVAGAENRVYFATPWCGRTILGTWQSANTGKEEVGEDQIEAFLAEIRTLFPRVPARRADVLYVQAGRMPMERRMADGSVRLARHSTLLDHGAADGPDGLLSLRSVKWTTARLVAEHAVDWAAARLGGSWGEWRDAHPPVARRAVGGDGGGGAGVRCLARLPARVGRASR